MGTHCYWTLNKARVERKIWVNTLYNLREGYMKAAEFLLTRLPLNNPIITALWALNPSWIQDESVGGAWITLGKALPNVVDPKEIGQIDFKVACAESYSEERRRLDVDWWSGVMRDVRFPILGKMVKAFLSIFTGPLIEGSFNLIDDILEADRCSMTLETYERLAIVKSAIKAREWTATTMKIEQPLRRSCLESYSTYQLQLKSKKEREEALKKRKLKDAAKVLSSVRASKLVHQARNTTRPLEASS